MHSRPIIERRERKIILIVNAASGPDNPIPRLRAALHAFQTTHPHIEWYVRECMPGSDIVSLARLSVAECPDMIVAAGGDGTVNAVLAQAVGTDVKAGVIPLGTFNHFARHLSVPLDIDSALGILATGHTKQIDTGKVNGRPFLNFCALGVYTRIILHRSGLQKNGMGKWRAFAHALAHGMTINPFMKVGLVHGSVHKQTRTPFVFVANNSLEIGGPDMLGLPNEYVDGVLKLGVVRDIGPIAMTWLYARSLFGKLESSRDIDVINLRSFEIHSKRRHLDVGIDGEIIKLQTPIRFESCPASLSVVVPHERIES